MPPSDGEKRFGARLAVTRASGEKISSEALLLFDWKIVYNTLINRLRKRIF